MLITTAADNIFFFSIFRENKADISCESSCESSANHTCNRWHFRVATVRGKKSGKRKFFQVREKSGNFGLSQGSLKELTEVREFQNFLKTEMAMAVSLIFRNINLQNWPHSFVKWLFFSLKLSALLEDLVAEGSCKGSSPAGILYKSIAGRYRPASYPDGPISARYRFIKNAGWVRGSQKCLENGEKSGKSQEKSQRILKKKMSGNPDFFFFFFFFLFSKKIRLKIRLGIADDSHKVSSLINNHKKIECCLLQFCLMLQELFLHFWII